ncbi:MAG: hypothetical protein QOJ91_1329 [Sphingomonadales bacterium]|jgi:hypothetical protein|nr:hypothetical protein [Sphingomonadales bacterium]
MIFTAAALFLSLAPPLSKRPMWELNDAQMCEAAHQAAQAPTSKVSDVPLINFGAWEVDCEARVLRITITVLDPRLDRLIVESFSHPDFCDAPNLVMFRNRGWRFEMQFRFTDGTAEITRPCEGPGGPANPSDRRRE